MDYRRRHLAYWFKAGQDPHTAHQNDGSQLLAPAIDFKFLPVLSLEAAVMVSLIEILSCI